MLIVLVNFGLGHPAAFFTRSLVMIYNKFLAYYNFLSPGLEMCIESQFFFEIYGWTMIHNTEISFVYRNGDFYLRIQIQQYFLGVLHR